MQLGELFFKLGFQSTGTGEATAFNNTLEASQQIVDALSGTMEKLSVILEKIALKMGAITGEELDKINTVKEGQKIEKQAIETTQKQNRVNKDKAGLLGMINTKMQQSFGAMNAARLQIMGVSAGLTYFVKKASDAVVHLDKISSSTGLSINSLQRLGDMAAQGGASLDDVAGAVANFQKNSVDIMLGRGGNIGPFQFLGIDPHQDPIKILDKLSAKLKSMPTALGTTMAKDMGLSDDLIYFLRNSQNLKPIAEETVLTDKEVKRLKDFNFEFSRVWEQSKRVLQKFAAFMTPFVNLIVYGMDRVTVMFGDLTNKIEPYLDQIQKFLPVIATLGMILFAAFFPVTAIILALGLAFEDLWSFLRGDDSVIGRMVDYFKNIEWSLENIIRLWYGLRNLLTIGDYSDYYAEQSQKMIERIRGLTSGSTGATEPVGVGGKANSLQNIGDSIMNNTININGAGDIKGIKTQVENAISDGYRKMDRGQKMEK